jgi:hypothetical protein
MSASALERMSVHILNTGPKSLSTSGSSKLRLLLLRKMAAWQSLLSASSAESRGNLDSGRRAGNWSRFFSSGACGWSTEPSASRDKGFSPILPKVRKASPEKPASFFQPYVGPVVLQDCQLLPQREIFEGQLSLILKPGFRKRKQQNQCIHHDSEACPLERLKSMVSGRTEFWQWTPRSRYCGKQE